MLPVLFATVPLRADNCPLYSRAALGFLAALECLVARVPTAPWFPPLVPLPKYCPSRHFHLFSLEVPPLLPKMYRCCPAFATTVVCFPDTKACSKPFVHHVLFLTHGFALKTPPILAVAATSFAVLCKHPTIRYFAIA